MGCSSDPVRHLLYSYSLSCSSVLLLVSSGFLHQSVLIWASQPQSWGTCSWGQPLHSLWQEQAVTDREKYMGEHVLCPCPGLEAIHIQLHFKTQLIEDKHCRLLSETKELINFSWWIHSPECFPGWSQFLSVASLFRRFGQATRTNNI